MDDTLFIPQSDLAAPAPQPPQDDRLWRLRRLFIKYASNAVNFEEGTIPAARVHLLYCPVCGSIDWSSSMQATSEKPAGLLLVNWMEHSRFSGCSGCPSCMAVDRRAPEVVSWIQSVVRTRGLVLHRLPSLDQVC